MRSRLLPWRRSLVAIIFAASVASLALTPNDPSWTGQLNAGINLLNLPAAWDVSQGRASVQVAVLDEGVNSVQELAGRVDPGINFTGVGSPSDTSDEGGHGTMVGTIIAATINNGVGIAGVAPLVHIVPVKMCTNSLLNDCTPAGLSQGLEWVATSVINGSAIRVVNISLGFDSPDSNSQYWLSVLDSLGVIVVASSGNNGDASDPSVRFPANDPLVVAVGGVLANGQRRDFSSYGPELDLAAPAQTYAVNNTGASEYFEGTSASAPFISGLAALFKSTQPQYYGTFGRSRADTGPNRRTDFVNAARVNADGTTRGWSQDVGYGVPNAWATIYARACSRYDFNGDAEIDVSDDQAEAGHYGHVVGDPEYNVNYDLHPSLTPDGDVDIQDLQRVFGWNGFTCPR